MSLLLKRIDAGAAYVPLTGYGDVSDVTMSWRAVGGDWELNATITATDDGGALRTVAPSWLGQHVLHPASGWRGIVAEVVVAAGFSEYTWSLADYANRLWVVSDLAIGTVANNLRQQARHGVWQAIHDTGEDTPAADLALLTPTELRKRARALLAGGNLDLGNRADAPTVQLYAIGRLPACRRFVTNVWRNGTVIGYDMTNAVKATLTANENGASTAMTVTAGEEAAFVATASVGVHLDDGELHVAQIASTSSGTINITPALPGAAADVVASTGKTVRQLIMHVSTWLAGVITDTDLTAGIIVADTNYAVWSDYTKHVDAWSLMEALATSYGDYSKTLTVDAAGNVHYASIGTGETPQYQVTPDGAIRYYGGGAVVSRYAARPGWYRDTAQQQTLYVDTVEYSEDDDYPRLSVSAVYVAA